MQPTSSPARPPGSLPARLRRWLLLPLILGAIWTGIALQLRDMQAQVTRGVERDAANLAGSAEQHIIRTLGSVDQALRFMQVAWRQDPAGFDLLRWTDAYLADSGPAVQIALIGANGLLRASGLDGATSTAPVDLSDRDHFRIHAGTAEDRLFISRPVLGRVSGRQTIQLTRTLRDAAGLFGGVIVISIDPALLSAPYASLDIGTGSLLLAGRDGIIRAWASDTRSLVGRTVPPALAAQFAAMPNGHARDAGELDGIDRLIAFRAVQGHPLIIAVGIDRAHALADFRALRLRMIGAGLVLSLAILVVGPMLLRQRANRTRSDHTLRATLRSMDQGVIMSGRDGRVELANGRAAALLGLAPGMTGRGQRIAPILRRLGRAVRAGAAAEMPPDRTRIFRLDRPDGTCVETKVQRTDGGGLLLTCSDVTGQQAAIAAQAAARAAAEAASRTKSEFLANMSHEIRTPMNGVIGMIQVLRHSGLDDRQRDMCEVITRSANALLTVLNDILDYSKLEAGRLELELHPARIEVLTSDVVALMRHAAEAKSIGLRFHATAALPPVMIDLTRVRQVLSNLLSNAVKFSDKGEITVTLDGEPDPAAPDARFLVRLSVADQGIGMAEEDVARLFTRFTQVDGSSTRRFGGTGLGLAISQDLVRMMGGTIGVSSRPGLGSRFLVTLPLAISTVEPQAEHEGPAEAGPGGPLHHLRILVAEDDEVNRIVVRSLLAPGGHDITFAENGAEAVQAARAARFDVILMDVMMPEMDGPTATRCIRDAKGPNAGTPIVALTANAMSGDRERYLGMGMDAYVSKPIARRDLYGAIESTLGLRAFPRAEAEQAPPPAEAAPEGLPDGLADGLANAFDDLLADLKA